MATWTDTPKASIVGWTDIPKAFEDTSIRVVAGSPLGLLLSLTYATTSNVIIHHWINTPKASITSAWTTVGKAPAMSWTDISKTSIRGWTNVLKAT